MKKIINTLITCSAIAIFSTGCGPSKEAIEAKAQYDLAERNGDLDSMYLAASKLVSYEFETETYKRKLIGINQGIDLTKEIEKYLSENEYDLALEKTKALKGKFPDSSKAVLLESRANNLKDKAEEKAKLIVKLNEQIKAVITRFEFVEAVQLISELNSITDPTEEIKKLNAKLINAQELDNKMESSAGDHDHESAMFFSDLLLNEFPDYPKAKKRFRESGLIVEYMVRAQSQLISIWDVKKNGFVQIKNEEGKEETDIIKVGGALKRATELINKAKELDKFFVDAKKLEKSINAYKNYIVYLKVGISGPFILQMYGSILDSSANTFNSVLKVMQLGRSYVYAVDVFDESIQGVLDLLNKNNGIRIDEINEIKFLETKENAPLIKWLENTISSTFSRTEIFTQTSTLNIWSSAIDEARSAHTKAYNEFRKLMPVFKENAETYKNGIDLMIKINILDKPEQTKELLSKRKDLLSA